MKVVGGIFRIIIGFIFGAASALALSPAFAAFGGTDPGAGIGVAYWIFIVACMALAFFAPTIRRAFGRGFLVLGASTFALPISVLLLSGRVASDTMATAVTESERAGAALGAGIAGTVMTGAAGFVGFFLGAIFLIIGLVLALGGRREVIVVNHPGYAPPYPQPPSETPHQPVIDAKARPALGASDPATATNEAINRDVEPRF